MKMKVDVDVMKEPGLHLPKDFPAVQPKVQLFGHVVLVQGYGGGYAGYTGCYALVNLRDTPGKTVAVMTTDARLQSLFETALSTRNLIYFTGQKLTNPPSPGGGTWAVDVYSTDNVCVYDQA